GCSNGGRRHARHCGDDRAHPHGPHFRQDRHFAAGGPHPSGRQVLPTRRPAGGGAMTATPYSSDRQMLPDDVVPIAAFSHAVECIYDCALDPARWPEAIRALSAATRCMAGVIGVTDLITGAARLQQHWGYGPGWLERMVQYGPEIAEIWSNIPDLHTRPLDEPVVMARELDREVVQRNRYYNEWVRPQGIIDAIGLAVLRQRDRIGEFSLSRHESEGIVTER